MKKAAYEVVQHARDEALIEGVEETRKRIEKGAASRGYDLDPFVVEKENIGHQSGRIFVPTENWYYKFFEFGTVHIPAIPFIRPAHRKMRKVFREEMGDNFEKFVQAQGRPGVTVASLMDVDPYTMKQVDELAQVLMSKFEQNGWNDLPVDEQVELRLLITLLDGFAEPNSG